jgi:Pentapeptide repeats (8 copies)
LTVGGPGTPDQEPFKPEELKLRKREVRYAGIALVAQFLITLCALAATAVAASAAQEAGEAVKVAARGMEQQANADRLSTAISSIGGEQAAERVAGFTLLGYHVQDRVRTSDSPEERLDAYNLYTASLDVLENYLRNPPQASTNATEEPAGLGFGRPNLPYDNKYAARELRSLMGLRPQVEQLRSSIKVETKVETQAPTVDLSNVQLAQQSWADIDFAWLGARFFLGIDLRGANLTGSIWGASFLEGAHLQCAELKDANLQGARLVGADLRGANLEGADFTKADLKDVKLDGATGWQKANGLPEDLRPLPGISRVHDGIDKCLDHKPYWQMPGAAPNG